MSDVTHIFLASIRRSSLIDAIDLELHVYDVLFILTIIVPADGGLCSIGENRIHRCQFRRGSVAVSPTFLSRIPNPPFLLWRLVRP